MKKKLVSFVVSLAILSMPLTVQAHPGRTDSSGGHYVRTAGWGYPVGSYHYHNGGGSSSSSGGSSSGSTHRSSSQPKLTKAIVMVEKAYLFAGKSIKTKVVGTKSNLDSLIYISKSGKWVKVGFYDKNNKYKTGYIHINNVSLS